MTAFPPHSSHSLHLLRKISLLYSQLRYIFSGTQVAMYVFGSKLLLQAHKKEDVMKASTKDQTEGKFHEVKGKIKEVAGKISDNPKLESQGAGEKIAGKVQQKIGQVKKVLGE